MSRKVKCELFNDHFQNYKRYGIPKAQLVIADIQKVIELTEPIKLTEKEQQSYKVLKNVWKAIEKRDVEEAFYYWRMEDETEIDKNSQITVMKKFLNEVAE